MLPSGWFVERLLAKTSQLHYWNTIGVPLDASYYTGIHLMSLSDSETKNPEDELL